jgi:hypothetical protein
VVVSNGGGSLVSEGARLRVRDPGIVTPPANENRELGQSVTLGVAAVGTGSLGYQWYRDGVAVEGATGSSLTRNNLQPGDAGRYTVVVTGTHGTVTSAPAALTVNLATADGGFNPGANGAVHALAELADGSLLVGGGFGSLGGQPRNNLGRLSAEGTLDGDFNPGANGTVYAMAVDGDGRIVVGGGFTALGGRTRNYLGRLDAQGAVDLAFDPGANSVVSALALQTDGRILVGGQFSSIGGLSPQLPGAG